MAILAAGAAGVLAACGGASSASVSTSVAASAAPSSAAASPAPSSAAAKPSAAASAAPSSVAPSSAAASASPASASAAASASASASASSSGAASGSPAPAGSTPTGQVIRAETAVLINTLETGNSQSTQGLEYLWPFFDGLTWMDGSQVKPALATSWKNTDDLTWEFTLGDWKFQNGRAVTTADVIGTFERTRNPNNKFQGATVFTSVDKIEAPDAKTIRITTKKPNPTLPNILSLSMILPMQELNQMGATAFFKNPIGTGAFKPVQVSFTEGLKFTAMGGDWKTPQGVPHVKDVTINFIPDDGARVSALRSGNVDAVVPVPADQIDLLKSGGFIVKTVDNPATVHFLLHPEGPDQTKDLRVRQAINYAVNKESIVKNLEGGIGRVDQQLIGPSCLGYNSSLQAYAYDPNQAKQLLSQAGLANGFSIPMEVLNIGAGGKDIGLAVAGDLAKVGITTSPSVEQVPNWVSQYNGPADQRKGLWVEITNWDQTWEPDSTWRWYTSDTPASAGRRWNDQTFDDMYQKAKSTFDRNQRNQLYQQAGKYLRDQAPDLFLFQLATIGASTKAIKYWEPYPIATMWVTLERAS